MKKKKHSFAFLSSINHRLLPYFFSSLQNQKNLKDSLIIFLIDKKKINKKDLNNFRQRTGNKFKKKIDIKNIKKKYLTKIVSDHNCTTSIKIVKNNKIDFGVNIGSTRKFKKELISAFKFGIINIHPANLPYFRGASSVEWSMYNKKKLVNTIHFINESYDKGKIIKKEFYKFNESNNYQFIRSHIFEKGISFLMFTLGKINMNINLIKNLKKQNENKAKFWKPMSKNIFKILKTKIDKYGYKI